MLQYTQNGSIRPRSQGRPQLVSSHQNFSASDKIYLETVNGYAKFVSNNLPDDSTLAALCLLTCRYIITRI